MARARDRWMEMILLVGRTFWDCPSQDLVIDYLFDCLLRKTLDGFIKPSCATLRGQDFLCAEREVYSIWKHPPVRFAGQDFLTLLRTLPPFAYLASQSRLGVAERRGASSVEFYD